MLILACNTRHEGRAIHRDPNPSHQDAKGLHDEALYLPSFLPEHWDHRDAMFEPSHYRPSYPVKRFLPAVLNWSTHLRQALRNSLANNIADGGSLSAHLLFVNLGFSELSCNEVIELLFLSDKLIRVLFCLVPRSMLITSVLMVDTPSS